MAFDALVNDLKYAQVTGVYVEVHLVNAERLFHRVHAVEAEDGYVSFYSPQHHQDQTTTRKVPIDLIATLTVTDVH